MDLLHTALAGPCGAAPMTDVAVLTPDPADPTYSTLWPGVLDRLGEALATAGPALWRAAASPAMGRT